MGKQVKGNKKSLEDIKNEYGYNNFDESAQIIANNKYNRKFYERTLTGGVFFFVCIF